MCSHAFDLLSVVAQERNNVHLDKQEAVYTKLHSSFLVPTKGICESIVFSVNITPLSHLSHISNVCTFFHSFLILSSVVPLMS